jgi:hypothetical protein
LWILLYNYFFLVTQVLVNLLYDGKIPISRTKFDHTVFGAGMPANVLASRAKIDSKLQASPVDVGIIFLGDATGQAGWVFPDYDNILEIRDCFLGGTDEGGDEQLKIGFCESGEQQHLILLMNQLPIPVF